MLKKYNFNTEKSSDEESNDEEYFEDVDEDGELEEKKLWNLTFFQKHIFWFHFFENLYFTLTSTSF